MQRYKIRKMVFFCEVGSILVSLIFFSRVLFFVPYCSGCGEVLSTADFVKGQCVVCGASTSTAGVCKLGYTRVSKGVCSSIQSKGVQDLFRREYISPQVYYVGRYLGVSLLFLGVICCMLIFLI